MKPLNWLYLYILFLTSMFLTFAWMYYNKQYIMTSLNKKNSMLMNPNWSW